MKSALDFLRQKSVLHAPPGKPFILKSGAESMTYIDVRLTALSSDGLHAVAEALYERLAGMKINANLVAGVALGGCPLATGVSLMSGLDALYVRPEAKDHGTGKLVEGAFHPGDRVVLLEDVITSGGSTLKAIAALRSAGLTVAGVIAVLDREQGGAGPIQQECPFTALFTLKELLA
jgi:orotate phosphoribosyltransferase